MDEVMEWVQLVTMEPENMTLHFDITKTRVLIDAQRLLVTTTRAPCYKTFYVRNLRMLVIS